MANRAWLLTRKVNLGDNRIVALRWLSTPLHGTSARRHRLADQIVAASKVEVKTVFQVFVITEILVQTLFGFLEDVDFFGTT